jgi:hypothetical protein
MNENNICDHESNYQHVYTCFKCKEMYTINKKETTANNKRANKMKWLSIQEYDFPLDAMLFFRLNYRGVAVTYTIGQVTFDGDGEMQTYFDNPHYDNEEDYKITHFCIPDIIQKELT